MNSSDESFFLVATTPDARRKGYGEAVVRHALQTAHEATGIRRTVLHATEDGYPIYLRTPSWFIFRIHISISSLPSSRNAGIRTGNE
jgi:GNAT superfamily N-acetyltransferase